MWTLLPHQLTHSPCNTLMMVVLLAEHSLPCPQVLASAHASGIILSGHSSLRRPSRKRTDSPSSVLSCRLRTPWTGAGVPPQPPARPAGPCPPSWGLCHSSDSKVEHPCGVLWSSCGTGQGDGGLRMVEKGEEEAVGTGALCLWLQLWGHSRAAGTLTGALGTPWETVMQVNAIRN